MRDDGRRSSLNGSSNAISRVATIVIIVPVVVVASPVGIYLALLPHMGQTAEQAKSGSIITITRDGLVCTSQSPVYSNDTATVTMLCYTKSSLGLTTISTNALRSSVTNSSTITTTSTSSICVPLTASNSFFQGGGCLTQLSYQDLQTYVSSASSVNDQNGAIYIHIGGPACTIWAYALPNRTNVIVSLGATGNTTCV
jgi:hypothetical protein